MTRSVRVARGTLAAFVSTFVAAFSHAVAGGPLPGTAGLLLCFVFSWLVCIVLAGRRRPRMRLAGSVAASQALFHFLFASLGSGTANTLPTAALQLGHEHGVPLALVPVVGHAHTAGDMWFAHLVAAVVTFLALAFGERSAMVVVRTARRFVISLLPRMPELAADSAVARVAAVRVRASTPRLRRLEFAELRHRGPPALWFS